MQYRVPADCQWQMAPAGARSRGGAQRCRIAAFETTRVERVEAPAMPTDAGDPCRAARRGRRQTTADRDAWCYAPAGGAFLGASSDLYTDVSAGLVTGGATATGDGVNVARLIDDDEATNWASLTGPVAGKGVVVDLAGERNRVSRVQVSAMLRPAITGDPDPGGQNRFTALRQFRVLACNAVGNVDCTDADDYTPVFTSPADAFPSVAPRPRAPELILRSFDIPDVNATHLRFEVVTSQCTGGPDYAGEQDADPRAGTDCTTNSPQAGVVRAAEFQVFSD